jgi:hypothetical protein
VEVLIIKSNENTNLITLIVNKMQLQYKVCDIYNVAHSAIAIEDENEYSEFPRRVL